MEIINQLLELFPYAVMGSIIAGAICGFLGVFVISQRVVFLGAVLTQVSIAGVAFSFLHIINFESIIFSVTGITVSETSFWHGFEPILFSIIFAIISILLFSAAYRQKFLPREGILAIIFVISVALRILFIQKSHSAEVAEIESILKGDILFIGAKELLALCLILFITLSSFLLFRKQLQFVTFDAETAEAHGLRSKFWLLFFYIIVGIGISLTTRFVGDVFTFAFLIIPASIGLLLGKKVLSVFFIAVITGAVIPPAALVLAFKYDLSSGPTATILSFIILIIVFALKKLTKG